MFRFLPLVALVALVPLQPIRADDAKTALRPVDVVICLDTSNSMDGLIASAKIKLWDIVNDLARAKPSPDLCVALYSYGNDGYDSARGWVRKELDLTRDLDEIYRKLNGLSTNGGSEYVARVCHDAIGEQKWSSDANALKIIFVCGNEPAAQDKQIKLSTAAEEAKKAGVIVNPVYCGADNHADAQDWKEFAAMSGGRFASISQDRGTVAIATPFDKELGELSARINSTYLAFGALARQKVENQVAQDANAARLSAGAAATRAATKGGGLYRNSDWDLVDRLKDDPKFDVTKLPEAELPEEMRKLKPEERPAYIKKKAAEREAIQKKIAAATAQRDAFLRDHQKKNPSAADQAFDAAVRKMLREQAATKGMTIP